MIGIIDYGVGNIASIGRAFDRLAISARLVSSPSEIKSMGKLILPGVGHATAGMSRLRENGLISVLEERAQSGIPFLGICLGMQLLTKESAEGDTTCLGLIDGRAVRFVPRGEHGELERRVPHMGWNSISPLREHPLLAGITEDDEFYFAHSYFVQPRSTDDVLATTPYQGEFPSVIAKDNIMGVQFHPEKSHSAGERILKNFAEL